MEYQMSFPQGRRRIAKGKSKAYDGNAEGCGHGRVCLPQRSQQRILTF